LAHIGELPQAVVKSLSSASVLLTTGTDENFREISAAARVSFLVG